MSAGRGEKYVNQIKMAGVTDEQQISHDEVIVSALYNFNHSMLARTRSRAFVFIISHIS